MDKNVKQDFCPNKVTKCLRTLLIYSERKTVKERK